ncbi:RNA polymerase sigma factor FliA [Geopseudomonas guangdongensis]|uniref:RNA polymerase sigma factor FliA n=1 Tax=Geopseudomonas guangdongensis TaxID=1245526 RepID=A0A1H2EN92_9GAMM|nr:RNA polymerase sigma factor FliA [Pseudomonas guangdongensis]SDT96514.1 RNA polymerase, sigma 28 subunit, SigD/FliA/WhiG [Pseudomonas guangdongensis]
MYTAQGKLKQRDLLEQHLPLVRRQALSLQLKLPACVELDDLIQAGTIGLLDALKRFDANQGASFATFASQRIRGAMLDELRSRDWVPRRVRRNARALDETLRLLEQRLGRAPEEREIAAALGIDLAEYRQLLLDANGSQMVALDEMGEDEIDAVSATSQALSPFAELAEGRDRERLIKAIEALPEREKLLLALYYQEDLNLKEIGAVLGVSESRVCQLHSQAVARLRSWLSE